MRRIKRTITFLSLIFLSQFLLSGPICGISQNKIVKLEVVTELANVRAEPDIGSPIIHLAKQGNTMDLLGQEGPWYHVRITIGDEKIIEGYVHESLVKKIQTSVSSEEQKETIEEPKKVKKEIPEKKPKVEKISYLPKISQIHINFSGGGNYSLVGDLNKGSKGFIDYYQNTLSQEKTGEFHPLHLNYLFGGEVSLPLGQGLHVGIGADYFYGKKESLINFTQTDVKTRPEIEIIPIRAFVSYNIIPEFYIKAGAEYILAECTYFYRKTEDETWQEWKGEADASQLGGFLGIGFVHDLGRHLSLFIEASGRYAQVKNLKGENIQKDSTGFEYKEEGYMYIYDGETPNKETFSLLFVRDNTPSGYGVSNPEKAKLNLSGLSLQIGLRIKFSLFQ